MQRSAALVLVLLVIALPQPGGAFHRQTPPITKITTSGDTELPRLAPPGRAVALVLPSGNDDQVVGVKPLKAPTDMTVVSTPGDNANPDESLDGRTIAWDTDTDPAGTGAPGRQVILSINRVATQPVVDPTGTSANPSVDRFGRRVAFESTGDLAGTGNAGARQIFLYHRHGGLVQVSTGHGTSRNPALSAKGRLLAFESTSDPATGADTGVAQLWLGDVLDGSARRITAGLGASGHPSASSDGRLIAFDSTADLAGAGGNTGVSQVFVYDPITETFARITDDAGGCALPAVNRVGRDWRVAFVCGGQAYYYMLRADTRFHVETPGGDATRVMGALGTHFLLISTTADLLAGGTTTGHRIYVVNLFKHPAVGVPGLATWFPTRGILPL